MSVSVSVSFGVTIPPLYKAPSFKSTWITMRGVGRGRVCLCASRLSGKGKKIQKQKELRMRGRANGIEPEFLEKQEQQQLESSSEEEIWQWSQTPHQLAAYVFLLAGIPLGLMLPDASWSSACYFLYLGVWTLYVGSHRSLGTKPPKKVSLREGILAPLFCSISLFGFYCLLHFFPNLDLQAFLSAYFALVGVFAVAGNTVDLVGTLLPTTNAQLFQLEVPEWLLDENKSPVQLSSTFADVLALCVGVAIVIAYKQAGAPFILNNFIATCIATEVLRLFSLGSFVTATTLLSGLLLYDVFWVFGSSHLFGDNVMVTVATSRAFDGPIKLIFPHLKGSSSFPYSLLGLGDVTVPGLLTALMLKFDRSQFHTKAHRAFEDSSMGLITKPRKIYFTSCIASYIFGLVLTIVANELSGVAQPALLYIVPSQLVGVSLISFVRSEFPLLLRYNDEVMGNSASVDQEN